MLPQDSHVFELIAKVALVGLLVYGSYLILKPFIGIVVWAIIIAITINPIISMGEKRLGWSRTKASVLFTIGVVALILIPPIGLAATRSPLSLHNLKQGHSLSRHPIQKLLHGRLLEPKFIRFGVKHLLILQHSSFITKQNSSPT